MKYKVYKESKLPDLDWDSLRKRLNKPIDSYKHRDDPIYHDDDDLWFWHDEKRKRISLRHIEKVEKATLHGFGKMIRITYFRGKGPLEDGKPAEMHLLDVANLDKSPGEIAESIQEKINAVHSAVLKSQPKRRFNSDE